MIYSQFTKKFQLPDGFVAPNSLVFENLVAIPLNRKDVEADMEAVNSSLEVIRETRGGSWPAEALTEEFNFLDLAWHEREFRDGDSFAYAVRDTSGKYIGCFYLYPMGLRTQLTEGLAKFDVDASWWVTAEAYEKGYYEKLYSALRQWLKVFPLNNVYYSNQEIPNED
ncbi:MAG: hypothetical protein WBB52_07490 [Acidimicrobiales bacterium]